LRTAGVSICRSTGAFWSDCGRGLPGTVNVGNQRVYGGLPVVNVVGGVVSVPVAVAWAERRRYGVAARMPATMKVRLRSGRHGCAAVDVQGASPTAAGRNCTRREPARHAGALYKATSGFVVGVTTAADPLTREVMRYDMLALTPVVAVKPALAVTTIV
jgi:hypothetical protein